MGGARASIGSRISKFSQGSNSRYPLCLWKLVNCLQIMQACRHVLGDDKSKKGVFSLVVPRT